MIIDAELVLYIIDRQGPIKARKIAENISEAFDETVTRKDVNAVIYRHLLPQVIHNEFFEWTTYSGEGVEVECEDEMDEGQVRLDSVIKVRYSNGDIRSIGFTTNQQSPELGTEISWIHCKSPWALGIIGMRIGDIYQPSGTHRPPLTVEIIEIE